MIRRMEFRDIEQIKAIDKICFKAYDKRTTEGIQGYIEKSYNSSLVYEIENKIVGFNFVHPWGSFAWFGPFGVHPQYQSKGIGKALIHYTIKSLKEDYKVSTIGLSTMPESQYNVGFYMSLGFIPTKLSLSLKKQLDFSTPITFSNKYIVNEIDINNELNYVTLKDNLKVMASEVFSKFDLTAELYLIKNIAFGTVFTLKSDDKIYGIVICHTKAIKETSAKNLHIKLAIINNSVNYKDAIDCIIYACTKKAESIKYDSISIDCNTYKTEICNYLISQHNFKIEKTQIMMLMGEENPFKNESIILLTRLAG